MVNALNLRLDGAVALIGGVQGVEQMRGALQRVYAGFGNGRVRHAAVHRNLQLQAAVVRGNHLVAKARSHHQVGLGVAVGQQVARPEFAAKFFVVGKVQLHRAR